MIRFVHSIPYPQYRLFFQFCKRKYKNFLTLCVNKNAIIKSMGDQIRKVVAGVFVGGCILLWLLAAMTTWDRSEMQYDQKMTSMQIFDSIRVFNQDGDPYAISYPYVGSTKTKTFHTFVSTCARDIRSTQLTGFKSRKDAVEAKYGRCTVCRP